MEGKVFKYAPSLFFNSVGGKISFKRQKPWVSSMVWTIKKQFHYKKAVIKKANQW